VRIFFGLLVCAKQSLTTTSPVLRVKYQKFQLMLMRCAKQIVSVSWAVLEGWQGGICPCALAFAPHTPAAPLLLKIIGS